MAERATYITKRRSALKGQITSLRGMITRNEIDPTNVQLRFKRLTELFHAYEELHIELELIEESAENAQQFEEVQNSFYEVGAMVAALPVAGGSRANDATQTATGFANSTVIERHKQAKLPIADLPKFNGDQREWLSFKNSFKTMIDSRTDVDDLNKFIYLRSALVGVAAKKLVLLEVSAENYKRGWDLLVELYEEKRFLISEHYAALFDNGYCKISPMQSVSADALSKLIDDAQQHMSMLESLDVRVDQGMIVCFLERALPYEIRNEWDKTLQPDVMPTFKQFYKFIHGYVNRLDKLNRDMAHSRNEQSSKRSNNGSSQKNKAWRSNSGARTLVTSTSITCAYCGQNHPIYKCAAFEKLNLSQRWEAVKAKSLCSNCLRDHKPPCKSSCCKKCDKFHNTLLHNEKRNNTKGGDKSSGSGASAS